jgi:hypothetical protein
MVAKVSVVAVLESISLQRQAQLYHAICVHTSLPLCSSTIQFFVLSTNTVADCDDVNAIFADALGHNISNDVSVSIACTALAPLYPAAEIPLIVNASPTARFTLVAETILQVLPTDTTFTVHPVPVPPVVVFVPVVYAAVPAFTSNTVSTNPPVDIVSTIHLPPLASIVNISPIEYHVPFTTGTDANDVIPEAKYVPEVIPNASCHP